MGREKNRDRQIDIEAFFHEKPISGDTVTHKPTFFMLHGYTDWLMPFTLSRGVRVPYNFAQTDRFCTVGKTDKAELRFSYVSMLLSIHAGP
jgi:hypothetical protein